MSKIPLRGDQKIRPSRLSTWVSSNAVEEVTPIICSDKELCEVIYRAVQYCKMIIVDQRYACELVTEKGKVFKFDAVECLINFTHSRSIQNPDIHFQLVTSYDQPGKLIAAGNCQYLRSAQMPSPMGMFLTAFEKMDTAMKFQARHDGKIYDWVLLNDQFKNLPSIKIEEE